MAVILEGGCRVSGAREGEPLLKGTLRIWHQIGCVTGAQAISLRIFEFAPGLSPGIRNDDCDEILYVSDSSFLTSDAEGIEDTSQAQGRGLQRDSPAGVEARSAPPLDPKQINPAHPVEVRRGVQGTT